jgi:bifunctional DNase/RNase
MRCPYEEVLDLISLRVDKVGLDPERGQAIVLLKDDDGRRYLPISVGPFEANAIALAVEEVKPPRPLTHDLLRTVIDSLEGKITRILIDDLKESSDGTGTFYAQITIEAHGRQFEVDSRPSDAIALAVRTGAPIFALEKVLDAAAVPEDASDGPQVH